MRAVLPYVSVLDRSWNRRVGIETSVASKYPSKHRLLPHSFGLVPDAATQLSVSFFAFGFAGILCETPTRLPLVFRELGYTPQTEAQYQRILSTQPRPTMNQIGPRSLLEFGGVDDELLASWLIWRKWIFDVDNRAAQETGYLFEPVLASCLGGEAVGSRHSPVKRLNDGVARTDEGRQIDCYDGENQLAYEFKLRVTIAASGQGRFAEELSFPVECRASGLTPVLIVLDPTPHNENCCI